MRAQRDVDFAEAAAHLAGNPFFKTFLSKIVDFREAAVRDACMPAASQPERVAAMDEVRAYDSILDLCESVGISDPID